MSLRLDSLNHLQSVSIQRLNLEAMTLPPGCSLRAQLYPENVVDPDVWRSLMASGQLQSLIWEHDAATANSGDFAQSLIPGLLASPLPEGPSFEKLTVGVSQARHRARQA